MVKEKIGNITLDYQYYPGEDLYCDGAVEDELLDIVQNNEASAYEQIIEEKAEWPILYHLSSLRGNIVEWIPMEPSAKVLEIGSGCGAITGTLAKKAESVTCIDLSKKRSHINAYRNKECENVTIHVGNFKDIEPELPSDYDYIFLIGVFEYGQGYIGTQNPYEEFLRIIRKHIKPEGRIVIAIENKFGLKYFAGCKEDHLGTYFSGIEDYPQGGGVRTFTRNGLEKICRAAGIEEYAFYYPYPDYKFMTAVYSDEYLPKTGELSNNLRNFDRDRMLLFDEKNVFDTVIREELFPLYSNSYMLIIGKAPDTKYVKYSNDRADKFAIRTDISQTGDGERTVSKHAMSMEAEKHIFHIGEACDKLVSRYQGSRLEVNRCEAASDGLKLEYLSGKTLEELLDGCLDRQDDDGFFALVEEYRQAVSYGQETGITDYDLIFGNIMVEGNKWTILDYEWTFDKNMTGEEITARALYCYMIGAWKRRETSLRFLKEKLGYTENAVADLAEKEMKFQRYVTGNSLSMVEIRNKIDCAILPIQNIALQQAEKRHKKKVQIYEDRGEGFSEAGSYFIRDAYQDREQYGEGTRAVFRLTLEEQVKSVRIDPAQEPCMLTVHMLKVNGKDIAFDGKRYILNGNLISDNTIVFATADPNMTLNLAAMQDGKKEIEAEFEVVPLSMEMAQEAGKGKAKKGLFR